MLTIIARTNQMVTEESQRISPKETMRNYQRLRKIVACNLVHMRRASSLTQTELAYKIFTSQSHIARLESCFNLDITAFSIQKIADYFHIEVQELFIKHPGRDYSILEK